MNEREIFQSAIDISDANDRQSFLDGACGTDVALRDQVEQLLRAHDNASRFLETPAAEQLTPGTVDAADATALLPKSMPTPHANPAEDAVSLEFLEPSTKPGSLGRLAHYEVLEILGRGAFGIVLKAFDEKLHRMVAIKVMNPELAATSPPRKRFLREAQSSAKVRHENIVSIYAVEEHPVPYLVMEYIPGGTLQQRLDQHGPLDLDEILRLGQQIASGLAAAHAQGLIHRDIKPANILIESGVDERVKITDFGLARATDDASLTQSGLIAGTPMYMAPEQAKGQPLDHRTDLFSLGSVLYTMASGRPPFRAANTIAVLKRLCEDTPRPITEVIPETPPWLCDIISKLHAKEPDDRFQSAKEVADVLGQHLAFLREPTRAPRPAAIAIPVESETVVTPNVRRPSKTGGWSPTTILLAVIAGVLVLPLVSIVLIVVALAIPAYQAARVRNVPVSTTTEIREPQGAIAETIPRETGWHGWPSDAPAPAIAPFDAAAAKAHQEAWAKHLGVPVEYTNSIGMKFRLIPPGEFTMGSTPEEIAAALKQVGDDKHSQECITSEAPQHKVILTQPIYLGVHEVTQAEYEKIMGTNPSHFCPDGPGRMSVAGLETANHPVELVSWNDAAEFCAKLSKLEKVKPFYFRTGEMITPLDGTGYRLPSEAEWEFACRAGTTTTFWSGNKNNDLARVGWLGGTSGGRTHVVGELQANPFGLYDIHGNVLEWVQDGWSPSWYGQFQDKPALNPSSPLFDGSYNVHRGGGFAQNHYTCRSSARSADLRTSVIYFIGFRVSLPVDAVKAALAAETPRATTTLSAKQRFLSDEWIDVLPLIDPQLDKWNVAQRTGKNAWHLERGELVVERNPLASKLILPLDSDWPAYECELELTRREGSKGFNLNIPTKQGECPLVFDAPEQGGVHLGSAAKGVHLKTGAQIVTGQRTTIRVEVRRQQSADQVTVRVNNATVGEWTGELNTMANTYREGFPSDRRVSLWILPGGNEFVFHRIRVRMLDGSTAETLRPITRSESPSTSPEEWQPLFNSQDLSGWKSHPDEPGNWHVEEGVLVGSEKPSYLFSERDDFSDFHLRAEVQINDGGDGGILIRSPFLKPGSLGLPGYEAQVQAGTPLVEGWATGAIGGSFPQTGWRLLVPAAVRPKADERFLLEVLAMGNEVETRINGEKVAWYIDPGRSFTRGHIALQQSGPNTAVQFYKIEVRPLSP